MIQTPIFIPAELNQEEKNTYFDQTARKIRYNLCIRFATWKARRLHQSRSKVVTRRRYYCVIRVHSQFSEHQRRVFF